MRKHFNYSQKSLSQHRFQQDSNKTTETRKRVFGSIGRRWLMRRTRLSNESKHTHVQAGVVWAYPDSTAASNRDRLTGD
ncbi:hypothetical protein M3I54_09810 [Paraburkholderia sp. CNPSo 3274]|uniref:hypothetical protein n=1 Tax=Paraburkholderia sp. CNPSo 3274 TaxID=2940932 RepID=UPI0020B71390|nr:hypothetical protein [Paraburkholderia sp. CNPSo 3274]MCP3707274.1 hypothetical protein [Paraburkholderia sp. CNPSo 3274]